MRFTIHITSTTATSNRCNALIATNIINSGCLGLATQYAVWAKYLCSPFPRPCAKTFDKNDIEDRKNDTKPVLIL